MTARIIWAPRAEADVPLIYDYIAAVNPPAAASLAQFPERGRPIGRHRELAVVRP